MPNGFAFLILNALLSAAIGSGVGALATRFTKRDELRFASELAKQRVLWETRFGSVHELKRTAGYLYEHLSGHAAKQHTDELYAKLGELNSLISDFAEREDVAGAIRDFYTTAGWALEQLDKGREYENRDELMREIRDKFHALIQTTECYLDMPKRSHTKAPRYSLARRRG